MQDNPKHEAIVENTRSSCMHYSKYRNKTPYLQLVI